MPNLPETRQSLLIRLTEVDPALAWSTFLEIYEPAIYRFALTRGLQDADARDVTQQVLIALHAKVDDWDIDPAKGSFRGWLFRVARNAAGTKLRERRRRSEVIGGAGQAEPVAPDDEEASAFVLEYRRQVFRWAAESVCSQYEPKTWQAFWRTTVEDEPVAQVANDLGISVGAVYAGKCRIMARLRDVVSEFTQHEFDVSQAQPASESIGD